MRSKSFKPGKVGLQFETVGVHASLFGFEYFSRSSKCAEAPNFTELHCRIKFETLGRSIAL